MASVYTSDSSPFYRSRFSNRSLVDKGNLGPPIFGPYQQTWNAAKREWRRPDGSRASLAGLGDMTLPTLDLSNTASQTKLFNSSALLPLAGALVLGLGGGWAMQNHHKLVGGALLGLSGIAAVLAVLQLKRNSDALAAQAAWTAPPAPMLAGYRR